MLVKEGHGTELGETAVNGLKPLVLIKRDLATRELKAPPAAEIPGAAPLPTQLRAAVAGTLAWDDDELRPRGPSCWAAGLRPWPEPATGQRGPAGEERSRRLPRVLQCSATCGVGAIWRTVRCSTGSDDGCATANKPVPARRCSLRPCSAWRVGNWSKVKRRVAGREHPKKPTGKWLRGCLPCGWSIACARGGLCPHGSQRQRGKIGTCHRV